MMNRIWSGMLGLTRWRLLIGTPVQRAPHRSVVLFPIRPGTLHCGLAGMVAVKGAGASEDRSGLAFVFEDVSEDEVPDPESLSRMEAGLAALQQDSLIQYSLHVDGTLDRLSGKVAGLQKVIACEEAGLEAETRLSSAEFESRSAALIRLKDVEWGLGEDLLRNQEKILDLGGRECLESPVRFRSYHQLNLLLNSMDRLEVRGRDSAGIEAVLRFRDPAGLSGAVAALEAAGLADEFRLRSADEDLGNGSIRCRRDTASFVWKTASVSGELGRNCRELRRSIREDALFRHFLAAGAEATLSAAHTRWASVGAINIANCHPVNNHICNPGGDGGAPERDPQDNGPHYGDGHWAVHASLNGDIDNHAALLANLEAEGICADARVTTDTKVIPLQIEKYLRRGLDLREAFRHAVCDFEGSHAIAVRSDLEPGRVYLALRGSGQALFVGLARKQHVFASEVYGLVEETRDFVAMNGERERVPGVPASRGQIFVLRDDCAGLEGIDAMYYDGHPLELGASSVRRAEITSRDIHRGQFRHYLLKEILDAPLSIRKTLRGKFVAEAEEGRESVLFNLGEEVVPQRTREAFVRGEIRRIFVIGQGTAAVAGSAIAEALSRYLRGTDVEIQARKASDLSGFLINSDLRQSIVIAVTQSGTTTDTNRAVTLAREAGAHVLAIVNRRQSDVTTKVHGVLYTSDGRDVEMSVASTKAFYSQIVAGFVLALYFAQLRGTRTAAEIARELNALQRAPRLMQGVIERRDSLRKAAWALCREKRHWAVVGSGPNKVAADEVRIKLSELCYKTISSDVIEDKKHIDLSAEPLILVLAAGSPDIVTGDIAKDAAIFKAHAARVVVVADEGEDRFDSSADHVIHVARAPFPVSLILNTLAGHLFGYFAACSLDDQAAWLRDQRSRLAELAAEHVARGYSPYESVQDRSLRRLVEELSGGLADWRRSGQLATLGTDTGVDLALLLKYAGGRLPLEDFREDFRERTSGQTPLDALLTCLGRAVDELSRPVDAIRHQAKTVTVGTSRRVEVLGGVLFDQIKALGFSSENLRAREVLNLKRLQKAVDSTHGFTLYRVRGLDEDGTPTDDSTITIERRGGISETMPSRVGPGGPLLGTKRTITRTGEVYAGTGRSDGAPMIIVPLIGLRSMVDHLLLMHVAFRKELAVAAKLEVLGVKATDVRNIVNESNLPWSDEYLDPLPIEFLVGEAVELIAGRIREMLARPC